MEDIITLNINDGTDLDKHALCYEEQILDY